MGVIQNSMNTAITTAMGGILGIKHIQGQQAAAVGTAREEFNKLEGDLQLNVQQQAGLEKKVKQAEAERNQVFDGRTYLGRIPQNLRQKYVEADDALRNAQADVTRNQTQRKLILSRMNELSGTYGFESESLTEQNQIKNKKGGKK